ncbi:MAG TPA: hypothetical protein VE170_12510, partial [Candidatus Limnocylindria bacterium]|nr:hypothetical protein [Candidatus Limnocylindria bacterium]
NFSLLTFKPIVVERYHRKKRKLFKKFPCGTDGRFPIAHYHERVTSTLNSPQALGVGTAATT